MRGHADLVDHCRDLALKRLRLVLALLTLVDRAAHLVQKRGQLAGLGHEERYAAVHRLRHDLIAIKSRDDNCLHLHLVLRRLLEHAKAVKSRQQKIHHKKLRLSLRYILRRSQSVGCASHYVELTRCFQCLFQCCAELLVCVR